MAAPAPGRIPRGPVTNRYGQTKNPADQIAARGPILNRYGTPQPPPVAPLEIGSATPALNPTNPNNPPIPVIPDVQASAFSTPAYSGKGPTVAPFGFDMSTPGVKEQLWQKNQEKWETTPQLDWVDSQQGQFQDPWAGESANTALANGINPNGGAGSQYWEGVKGSQNFMHGYDDPANAQSAFDDMHGANPGSLQPQFDAYYDRMKDKAVSSANSQAAGRGVYGSSGALNGVNSVATDVEAQRAKDATDFSLKDSANQLAWMTGLSGAGSAADSSASQAFQNESDAFGQNTDRTKMYGDLAFGSGKEELDRLGKKADINSDIDRARGDRLKTGIGSALDVDSARTGRLSGASQQAGETQNIRENRVNSLYGQNTDFSKDVQNFAMKNYDTLISGDQAAVDQLIDAQLAKMKGNEQWSDTQEASTRKGITDLIDTVISAKNGSKLPDNRTG